MPRVALIVDDEPEIASGCARILKELDLDSRLAFSVEDAIPLVRIHRLALVLADVRFPGALDGFDLTDHVQKASPATPVVLMSAYHSPSMEAQARNAGAAFLRKPFSREQLISTVQMVLPEIRR